MNIISPTTDFSEVANTHFDPDKDPERVVPCSIDWCKGHNYDECEVVARDAMFGALPLFERLVHIGMKRDLDLPEIPERSNQYESYFEREQYLGADAVYVQLTMEGPIPTTSALVLADRLEAASQALRDLVAEI